MNDCYLSLLLNFRALLSIDSGANLVNSKQAIGVILPDFKGGEPMRVKVRSV